SQCVANFLCQRVEQREPLLIAIRRESEELGDHAGRVYLTAADRPIDQRSTRVVDERRRSECPRPIAQRAWMREIRGTPVPPEGAALIEEWNWRGESW